MQVRGYEAEVRQLEALLQQNLSRDSRAQLLGQQADAAGQDGALHRDRLLSSTQKLQSSSERLKQSRQMVADMEVSALRLIRHSYERAPQVNPEDGGQHGGERTPPVQALLPASASRTPGSQHCLLRTCTSNRNMQSLQVVAEMEVRSLQVLRASQDRRPMV